MGEALCIFNDKAVEQKEETRDTHITMSLCYHGTHISQRQSAP